MTRLNPSAEERRRRHIEHAEATRLRVAIREEMSRQGLRADEIDRALQCSGVVNLLARTHWCTGDLEALRKAAEKLWPTPKG